jgi:hypothetical protein
LRQAASRPLPRTLGPAPLGCQECQGRHACQRIANTLEFVALVLHGRRIEGNGLSGLSVLRRPAHGRGSMKRPPSAQSSPCSAFCHRGILAAAGASRSARLASAGLTESTPMRQGFTVRPECQWSPPQSKARLLAMRFTSLAARRPRPNPSVKGTSCGRPQAAPYLER